MPDKLDILLGRVPPDPTPDTWIERALRELASGNDMGGVIDEIAAMGKEEGARIAKADFDRLYKTVGPAAAEQMRTDLKEASKRRIADLDAKRDKTARELAILERGTAHLAAIASIIEAREFVFKTRPFVLGNTRLRAHEVIEQINGDARGLLDGPRGVVGEPPKEAFVDLHRAVLGSVKFDLRSIASSDIAPNATFSYELEAEGLLTTPFPVCWFEWDVEPNHTIAALVRSAVDGSLSFTSLVRLADAGWCNWDSTPKDAPERINLLTDHVNDVCRAALVLLNSRSADKIEVTASPALNRRREKGGAPPLFSHTVVEIKGVVLNRVGHVTDRTHRSPRMHWRRGHLRHFRNGAGEVYRITPIAPMLVGRAELGRIEHDYLLAPPNAHANSR